MKKLMTLCFIQDGPRILLGFKKRGFGAGRWNGFGGKVHDGETIEAAARRELEEECGVIAREMERRGFITFEFEGAPDLLEVYVLGVSHYQGEPRETEEMRPQWFLHEEIPFIAMWPDDRYWLPLFLAGKNFHANFLFRKTVLDKPLVESDTIVRYRVTEVAHV